MKLTTIEPINIWEGGKYKTVNQLGVYNFHGYNFDGTDSMVSYRLGVTETTEGSDGSEIASFVSYSEGSVTVPDAIVQAWGKDDDPIVAFVLTSLNLEEA
jgi:hypothetical protein